MIPIKHLDELKTAPIDHVDFVATFIEVSDISQNWASEFKGSVLTCSA